jgi:non-ribosomal peptide synthetase component E (peptide arylation enzyme)
MPETKQNCVGPPFRFEPLQRLADFKIPEKISFLDDLPKGITGKVQRRALKETPSVMA